MGRKASLRRFRKSRWGPRWVKDLKKDFSLKDALEDIFKGWEAALKSQETVLLLYSPEKHSIYLEAIQSVPFQGVLVEVWEKGVSVDGNLMDSSQAKAITFSPWLPGKSLFRQHEDFYQFGIKGVNSLEII